MLRRYIRPLLGGRILSAITPLDVQSAYQKMIDRGLSSRTVRYAHSVLRSAIRQTIRWRLLLQDPTDGAQLPRLGRRERFRGADVGGLTIRSWPSLLRLVAPSALSRQVSSDENGRSRLMLQKSPVVAIFSFMRRAPGCCCSHVPAFLPTQHPWPLGNHCCRDLSVLAMCGFIPSFYGRLRTNTRPGQIHRRRSIPDSIPLVPAVKYCPWHQRILPPCRIRRPYHCFRP